MDRSVLGRGLSALIPEGHQEREKIQNIEIEKIKTSKFQPRQFFSEGRIKELAESIREKGIIQPILVRPQGDVFEIIAGERRYRAAKLLNLKEVPAIVKQVKDADVLELSLIENIQREELNRMEEARAFSRLAREFSMTHEVISKRVAKDRATISNTLRLLELPEKIQSFLEENSITMGHAKALLSLEKEKDRIRLCKSIMKKGLSVRQTENWVRAKAMKPEGSSRRKKDVHLSGIEEKLQHQFGTRVKILQGKKRGKIVIEYFSQEDLNRILDIIGS